MTDTDIVASFDTRREAWIAEAACRGASLDLFFPAKGASAAAAKRICHTCPVKAACLGYALEHRYWAGVYGGLSGRERMRHARMLRRTP